MTKNILIISLKIVFPDRDENDKSIFNLVKNIHSRGFKIHFFSAIPIENTSFHFAEFEQMVLIQYNLKNALLQNEYHTIIFTSYELIPLYYNIIKSLSQAKTVSLIKEENEKKKILEKFNLVLSYKQINKIYDFLKVEDRIRRKLISIIVLTFNQLETTKQCVDSLIKYTQNPYELIFVDNGSTDGTKKWIEEFGRLHTDFNCRTIFNKKNLGFAKANNQGIRIAKSDHIVLLNNDTILTEGWLSGLINCAESDPQIGLVGPMTNEAAGVQKVFSSHKKIKDLPNFDADTFFKISGIRVNK